ncbi:MAG: hypothetical protein ACJ72Y_10250 [Actinomycetes bacterium]
MTMSVEVLGEERTVSRSSWRAIVSLGIREGRRMLQSPVVLALVGFVVLMAGVRTIGESLLALPTARGVYDGITFFTALYLGLIAYMAAHLVTSSARRTGADAQLAASALSERQRNVGLCLGVLFGPGLLGALLMVTAALLGNGLELTSVGGFNTEPPMAGVFLVQLALLLVGGGLFGVMWATWLRFPGSLPLGFVVLVFGTGWLSDGDRSPVHSWPWFAPYITLPSWADESWAQYGSHYWHTVYLVGLCALAFCATMLRSRDHRNRWVIASGAVLTMTCVVGAVQVT